MIPRKKEKAFRNHNSDRQDLIYNREGRRKGRPRSLFTLGFRGEKKDYKIRYREQEISPLPAQDEYFRRGRRGVRTCSGKPKTPQFLWRGGGGSMVSSRNNYERKKKEKKG